MIPALEATGVRFGYDKTNAIFADWSAEFFAGETVAVTAPSGRGKSTLLYLLGLMLKPSAGQIWVDGVSASGMGDARRAAVRAHEFGFVFQDAALDPTRTVLDNVLETALYRGQSRSVAKLRAIELMEQFGVNLRAAAKPGEVSGGQAQRIALCRAMLNDPKILLADEPTGNLDPESSQVVVSALSAQARAGAAVIVVTHDPTVVAQCDRRLEL